MRANRRAHRAGEVEAPFGPVEAGAAQDPTGRAEAIEVDAEQAHKGPPARLQRTAAVGQDQVAAGLQGIGDGDPEASGQVVVAGARGRERLIRPGTPGR